MNLKINDLQRQRFSKLIGYQFNDDNWLDLALTHRSMSGARNNERLEFLGDSILNFIIADFLYQKFPQEKEGRLSRLRASLVKQETLADVARQLKLGDYLQLGAGELKSGGFRRDSILADTVEAVLGAIYRDTNDMVICKDCIYRWFDYRLDEVGEETPIKDPKSQLQEFLQGRKIALPVYQVTHIEGEAHNQQFTVSCEIASLSIHTQGSGNSRRYAEQAAAEMALQQIGVKKS